MVVTPDFYLQVVYICSLKVTHGGKTPDFYIYGKKISQGHSWWQNSRHIYIYIYVLSRSLMVAKLPTFIDIHMFSQGHSWWQNYRLLYMVKKQFSQGHSWWQNSRLIYICSLKVTHGGKKLPTFIFGIYIYMFSQNWYTTNEKEHIAHHIKHFQVSPKKQGKLRTKFVRSFQKHWKNHTKFIRNFFEISNGHLF